MSAALTSRRYSRSKAQLSDRRGRRPWPSGELDIEDLAEGSAIAAEKALTAQRGIGIWTARYVLMRGGFADAAPVGDSALATALQRLHKLPERPDADQTARLMSALRAPSQPRHHASVDLSRRKRHEDETLLEPDRLAVPEVRRLGGRGGPAAALQPARRRRGQGRSGSGKQFAQAGRCAAPGDAICQRQAPRFRVRTGGRKGRSSTRKSGRRCWTFPSAPPPAMAPSPRRIGHPTAARAVGAANGANPIALIVPCHRVIGADGTLTGYGGGLPLKRKLLEHEARVCGTDSICLVDPLRLQPLSARHASGPRLRTCLASLKRPPPGRRFARKAGGGPDA